jgi:hypothetical protein
MARASAGIFFCLVSVAVSLAAASTASGAGVCQQKVLNDWSDNGRVDGIYPLRCYQEALAGMPTDLRDYTNASDAIHRALTQAVSSKRERSEEASVAADAAPHVAADDTTAIPFPLVVLLGLSAAVFAAGTLGHFARRRRARSK